MFNWGILGLGEMAHRFADDLLLMPDARLYAVVSSSTARARDFAKKYKVPYAFGNYNDIAHIPDLGAVYIASPHTAHCAHTLYCLRKGIPVLCEKPFAMNAAEARRMVKAAKANDTFLMEAMWTRFLPTTQKVLELIEEGVIGEVKSLKADFGFVAPYLPEHRLFNRDLGGGALLDVGVYPLFLSLLLFGKPEEVKAMATFGKTGVDENCSMLLRYPNNKTAMLHSSIVVETATEAYIYGDKGCIRMNAAWYEATSITVMVAGQDPKDYFFAFDSTGYTYEAEEVMRCVSAGKRESDLMPMGFSLQLMELLDKVRIEAGIFYPNHDCFTKEMLLQYDKGFSMN
ncbi:MAG TPA: Gfo/Idh/MocA family oxidoreductase [Phaeodactylibacter sp.]|nr:Gfo/Idh/MocA family oxidoreductase [Phaeodactylibacter sp.]